MPRPYCLGCLAACLFCTGCGTFVNLVKPSTEEKAFGGVRVDVETIGKLADGESLGSHPLSANASASGGAPIAAAIMILGPFVDLPLSFLGDIVTYPLARRLDRKREIQAAAGR